MSSVRVVDLNEEGNEEQPAIKEAPKEEEPEPINEEVGKASLNSNPVGVEVVEVGKASLNSNPVGVEVNEKPKQEPNEQVEAPAEEAKVKPKPKPKASDIVPCPACNKNMTYKNLRYSHKCSPEPPPVKK